MNNIPNQTIEQEDETKPLWRYVSRRLKLHFNLYIGRVPCPIIFNLVVSLCLCLCPCSWSWLYPCLGFIHTHHALPTRVKM